MTLPRTYVFGACDAELMMHANAMLFLETNLQPYSDDACEWKREEMHNCPHCATKIVHV